MENNKALPFKFPRPTLPYRVFSTWNIHYACNYKCSYCHAPKPGNDGGHKAAYLPSSQWLDIWKQNYDRYGTWEILISGGEPFAYPGFMDLIIQLSKIHLVSVVTNLEWDVAHFVKHVSPDWVRIETSYHPEFTNLKTFTEKLRILKEHGFNPPVNFVPWPPQLEKMKTFKESVESVGCQVTLQPFIGQYENRSYPQGYTDEERKYFDIFGDECNLKTINFKTTSAPDAASSTKGKVCRMGQNYVYIHPDGAVSRCCRDHTISLGNMIEGTFKLLDEPVPCAADNCNCWRCMLTDKEDFWWRHWGKYDVTDLVMSEHGKKPEQSHATQHSHRINEALAFKDAGKFNEAIAVFEDLWAGPLNVDRRFIGRELSFLYEKIGDQQRTREILEKALELNAADAFTVEMLGHVTFRQGDYGAAERHLARAVELFNDMRSLPDLDEKLFALRRQLAQIHFQAGRRDRAREEILAALAGSRRSPNFHEHLNAARLLAQMGMRDEARAEIARGRETWNGSHIEMKQRLELVRAAYDFDGTGLATEMIDELAAGDGLDPFEKNKLLNCREFLQRSTVLSSKPLRLMVALTRTCNLQCIMCYDKYRPAWELSEKTMGEIRELFPYLEYIQWRGGEVFLYPAFEKLFDEAASFPHLCQDIVTNGLLIDEKWAAKLIRAGTKISLSIDGVCKETYEKVRRGGKFEDLTRSLRLLQKARAEIRDVKFPPQIFMNFVVLRSNYRDVEHIIEFAHEYGISNVQTVDGDTGSFPDSDPARNEEVRNDAEIIRYLQDRLPKMKETARRLGIDYRNSFPQDPPAPEAAQPAAPAAEASVPAPVPAAAEEPKPQEAPKPVPEPVRQEAPACRAPWTSIFIFMFDEVKPHCFCINAVGDARKDSLTDIWNNEAIQQYRSMIAGKGLAELCSEQCRRDLPMENRDLGF